MAIDGVVLMKLSLTTKGKTMNQFKRLTNSG